MLPSGNDASIVLAEHFGEYLYEIMTQKSKKPKAIDMGKAKKEEDK